MHHTRYQVGTALGTVEIRRHGPGLDIERGTDDRHHNIQLLIV